MAQYGEKYKLLVKPSLKASQGSTLSDLRSSKFPKSISELIWPSKPFHLVPTLQPSLFWLEEQMRANKFHKSIRELEHIQLEGLVDNEEKKKKKERSFDWWTAIEEKVSKDEIVEFGKTLKRSEYSMVE